MLRFVLTRLLRAFVTLMLVVTFAFVILRLSGDPAVAVLGTNAPASALAAFREHWGLNDSLMVQYAKYVLSILSGEFGDSMRDGTDALSLVLSRVPATLQLSVPHCCFRLPSAFRPESPRRFIATAHSTVW